MELSRVTDELQAHVKQPVNLPLNRWWGRRLTRALTRFAPSGDISGVKITPSARRASGVRVYRPEVPTSAAALCWIHGGGMVIGRGSVDDRFCAATARELGVVVVSAEYRLAPEHPFPAPLDDCRHGWLWLQRNAQSLGVDPARIALGGQSAGGGLAAALGQQLIDSEDPAPAAQWLFCPMLDDRTAARRELDPVDHWVWNNTINHFGWGSYLGVEPGAVTVPPYAVPARREDLRGLPPTWIGVGDIDLFHDEDLAYADALRAAGVAVTTDVVPGAPHGFESWAPKAQVSLDYVRRARVWLADALRVNPPAGANR